ncbi:MAG: RC-LH1 core complex protein PufX [Paracoccaceae bacterium]
MSDNDNILGISSGKARLTADALALMMKGAGYGLALCTVLVVIGVILTFIAGLLPEDSKFAPAPMEGYMIEINADIRVV